MATVRQRNTRFETQVAAALQQLGVHYRKNVKALPGSPDFANQSRLWAVFAHGCFWHHHTGCRRATVPKTNTGFWIGKFRANRRRDALAIRKLRSSGYRVVVVWECENTRLVSILRQVLKPRCVNA
jgi:DNA mismatch endonuclease Vsr